MISAKKALILRQMDEKLGSLASLKNFPRPSTGWLRAIREALGMTGEQLGRRLGVSRARIARIEKDEVADKLTLQTLRQTAEALDCVLVYALVPRTSLTNTVRERARKVAQKRAQRTGHTMRLEAQTLSERQAREALETEIERLVSDMPRELWNESA